MIHPFRAFRPSQSVVAEVVCPPYDVIDTAEARALAQGKALSFLRVIRPEIDLPEGTDEHADAVYAGGAKRLQALLNTDGFVWDAQPSLYVYRLATPTRSQTGIFACVSVDDYDAGRIVRHENTRQDKEDDRTWHILEQRAHAEPVMLTYRDVDAVGELVAAAMKGEPTLHVQVGEVVHTLWAIADVAAMEHAFSAVERLYVADGHHRCKASSRAAGELRGTAGHTPAVDVFPAVVFPMSEMAIMPYNRILRTLPCSKAELAKGIDFALGGLSWDPSPSPLKPGHVSMYLGRELGWHGFVLPKTQRETVADQLDVARLSEFVLEPMLGIADARTNQNIGFVGGIRGTAELERLVDEGHAQVAFSMYPTSIAELMDVSDAQLLMPPKSTWFEPKLLSGLLVHFFHEQG